MKYRNICQRINSRFVQLAGVRFYMDMDYKIREIRKMNIQYYLSSYMKQFLFQKVWTSLPNLLLNSQSCKYILRILGKQVLRSLTKMKKNTSWFVGCNLMGRECVGAGNLDEKAVREVKKNC